MIKRLNQKFQMFEAEVCRKFKNLRGDFETEVTRVRKKQANLGEAVAILAKEYSQKANDCKLSPDAYRRIEELLNT